MKRRGRVVLHGVALAALSAFGAAAEGDDGAAGGLQPYQMVRSLQLVQDRIAGGDHAALPMQKKLLELIDARFRDAESREFSERRNFDALMIYAMSGGNPATVAASLGGLSLDEADGAATAGVLSYLGGDVTAARSAMAGVQPSAHPQEVAAFLALVKGSVVAGDDARAGMAMLDRARLLAPGTLVEEAALRRTLALAVTEGDADRFMRGAEQYARRYLRSPYASQFAQTLIAGIAEMYDEIDRRSIEAVIDWMNKEQAQSIYLRLARRAAIDGKDSILDFASAKARQIAAEDSDTTDARSMLYSTIASVTSDTVDSVVHQLRRIDRRELSSADLALLEAAEAIAAEVVARPRVAFDESDPPFPDEDIEELRPATRNIGRIDPERALAAETETRIDSVITSARDKLDAIDRMLKEDAP